MKTRILSILLVLVLLCTVLLWTTIPASAATTSGSCGDNLTWTFDSASGTLTIKGSGKMDDYDRPGSIPWYNNKDTVKKIIIGSGVTSIGDYAFFSCSVLTSVTIPNSVSSIGQEAFCSCIGLTGVTIPNSVKSIGARAFNGCYNLLSVTIPNSVTNIIGGSAFWGCYRLTKITVASGNPNYSSDSYGVLFNKSKTELIQCPGAFKGNYKIQSTVANIGDWAFANCTGMTDVTIPNSVTNIGEGAFCSCTGLTGVTVPTSVTSIGIWAFSECTGLTSVTIPSSITSIEEGTFLRCTGLTSVTIPTSVTSIGQEAFSSCTSLTGVVIPNSVTSIGKGAFDGCTSLTSLTVPNSIRSIGVCAFSLCTSLTSVAIPDSVKSIGAAAFEGCRSLTSVVIPDSVTSIGYGVFSGCSDNLVIYGIAGSTAEAYANEYNIPFVALAVPKITTQPKSATVAVGESATFKVAATGGALSYQWQYKRSGATSWIDWTGKTEATLPVKGGSNNNGCQYRCVVSNPLGKKNSAAATLTVTTVAKPVITTQPKSVSMALGECMTFSCAATGQGTLTYQWQYKRSGATAWSNWSGKTETILNVVAGSNNNGCRYRCAVTNDGGTTYTDTATLTVTSSHECPGAAFTDMPAQGTIEHTAIDWAVRAGVTNGTSATTFSPNRVLTRSQVVTFLWRACGSPEPKTTKNPFTDVKTTDWFYKAVLWAVEQGITNGTSANKFSPNTVCSRSQTLTFLYRQQGSPAVGSVTVPYTDVTAGAFYENAMKWAYANGIDKGVTATTFAPNANCTRASTVVFLYRAITGQGRLS